MAKTILGVDLGNESLKLVLCKNGEVKKSAIAQVPQGLIREGRFTSTQAVSDLIKSTMRENRIRATNAAFVLPNEICFLRTINMPVMSHEQLKINIPYEFTDYLSEEPKNYLFDYAMLTDLKAAAHVKAEKNDADNADKASGDKGNAMELLAVAAPSAAIEEAREALDKAGMKLVKAAPAECALISLIRDTAKRGGGAEEYCILDVGYRAVRMYMFKGDKHMVTRVLEFGMKNVEDIIAEAMGVDVHLAHTYFISNYEDCQNKDYCVNAYNNIAVELTRALNFYRFNNPDSQLSDVWLCGGGVASEPLCRAITEAMDMKVHTAGELVRGGDKLKDMQSFAVAVGATMD
ncbi:MAG: pilus assembly protein PilM [Oscillospiraceae bacterium]|nr:pilus assembly protein PilM [Oscillospiraceae bacterium]